KNGTNNVVEFIAIVHALAYCQKNKLPLPIYSDSQTAIKWVKNKKANTRLEKNATNEKLFALLQRAEEWLANNQYDNPILKWQTDKWGEIPADFGRK
ncbi:MAG: reverse transcriptase-like protein, partial [Flammeovirgaceae bacterium]|nr:reverse transcriptase-like protein [Flammeovirgaceae bacterium]MDW8288415.1 RNase H family protein [Flammeovirgaceae bacterium]